MRNFYDDWNNDTKGMFFESLIYDYYDYYGLNPSFISSDKDGSQRFKDDYDIVMPDIVCNSPEYGVFFVECKSDFKRMEKSRFSILDDIEFSYKKFYTKIYPSIFKESIYDESIPTVICFGKLDYNDNELMNTYFMKIEELGNVERKLSYDRYGRKVNIFPEKEISQKSFQEYVFSLYVISDSNIQSDFSHGNIFGNQRNRIVLPKKKDMIDFLKRNLEIN